MKVEIFYSENKTKLRLLEDHAFSINGIDLIIPKRI